MYNPHHTVCDDKRLNAKNPMFNEEEKWKREIMKGGYVGIVAVVHFEYVDFFIDKVITQN